MEVKYICTFWGQPSRPIEDFVQRAIDTGYDGIELNVPDNQKFQESLLKSTGQCSAIFIAQQWLPPAKESSTQYHQRMTAYLERLAALKPLFINSHTGKDYFTFEENASLIEDCARIEEQSGISIIHETHRGRFTHHAASLIPYLDRYPDLRVNADFSHFCTVSESLLEDQEEILQKIIPRTRYIHARVGYDQAPQVNHPFAPEWKPVLDRFVSWWQLILDQAKSRGEDQFHICPEFGPAPYMPALPFTLQPVSDQWDINLKMMQYLKENLRG